MDDNEGLVDAVERYLRTAGPKMHTEWEHMIAKYGEYPVLSAMRQRSERIEAADAKSLLEDMGWGAYVEQLLGDLKRAFAAVPFDQGSADKLTDELEELIVDWRSALKDNEEERSD